MPTSLCGESSWRKQLMEKSEANKKRNEVCSVNSLKAGSQTSSIWVVPGEFHSSI